MRTNILSRLALIIVILGFSVTIANNSHATEQSSDWGSITWMEGGWTVDSMAIGHSAPLVNPDNCPVKEAGYATSPTDAGHSLFHTMALSAFMNHKQVRFLISGCVLSKPHIISISIR